MMVVSRHMLHLEACPKERMGKIHSFGKWVWYPQCQAQLRARNKANQNLSSWRASTLVTGAANKVREENT